MPVPVSRVPRRPALLPRPTSPLALRLAIAGAVVGALVGAGCVEPNRGVLEVNPAADSVQVLTGVTDTGFVRLPMPNTPVVVVKDKQGFRMPGVLVSFTPEYGSGFVSGNQVRTDSLGRASPTAWTAGPDSGVQTLWAAVTGAPNSRASRVAITSRVINPCFRPLPMTLGGTVAGTLIGRGCVATDNSLVQAYAVAVTTPEVWQFVARSKAFPAYVEVTLPTGRLVAYYSLSADSVALVRVALPAGAFHVRAGALSTLAATGDFQLTTTAVTVPPTCPATDVQLWVMPGTQLPASLAAGDCAPTLNLSGLGSFQTYADFYGLALPPDRTVTVRMNSSVVNTLLLLVSPGSGQILRFNDDGGGGTNALLQVSAQELGAPPGRGAVVWVLAASRGPAPGAYTLTVDP